MQIWPFLYLVSGALALTVFAFYMQLRIGYSNVPGGSFTMNLDTGYDVSGIASGIASLFLLAYGILPFVMKVSSKLRMAWLVMTFISIGGLVAGMYYILTFKDLNTQITTLEEALRLNADNSEFQPFVPVYSAMVNILKNGPYLLGSSAGSALLAGILMVI